MVNQMQDTTAITNFSEDFKWFIQNREKLLEKYKDQWIAISDKKVIDKDKNLTNLIKK